MPDIYEMEHKGEVAEVLEHFRRTLANSFGVTLTGNRLTIRTYWKGELVDVHAAILSVTTPTEAKDVTRQANEYRAIIDKYKKKAPYLDAELFHLEHGEWPK